MIQIKQFMTMQKSQSQSQCPSSFCPSPPFVANSMVLAICKVVGPKAASNEWLVVSVVPSVVRGSEAALSLFYFSFSWLAGVS